MGTNTNEHMRSIAVRMRERMDKGALECSVRRYLYSCGWTAEEVEAIIKFAMRKNDESV